MGSRTRRQVASDRRNSSKRRTDAYLSMTPLERLEFDITELRQDIDTCRDTASAAQGVATLRRQLMKLNEQRDAILADQAAEFDGMDPEDIAVRICTLYDAVDGLEALVAERRGT